MVLFKMKALMSTVEHKKESKLTGRIYLHRQNGSPSSCAFFLNHWYFEKWIDQFTVAAEKYRIERVSKKMSLLVVKVRWMDCECSCLAALLQSSSCEYWVVKEVPLFRKSYYICAPGNPQFLSSLPLSVPRAACTMLMFPTSVNAQHLQWRLFDFLLYGIPFSLLSLHKRLSLRCFRRWYWLKVSGRKSKHGNGVKMRRSKMEFRITCVVVVYLTFAWLRFQFSGFILIQMRRRAVACWFSRSGVFPSLVSLSF